MKEGKSAIFDITYVISVRAQTVYDTIRVDSVFRRGYLIHDTGRVRLKSQTKYITSEILPHSKHNTNSTAARRPLPTNLKTADDEIRPTR